MKKLTYLFFLVIINIFTVIADVPIITMTTNIPLDSTIEFGLAVVTDNSTVYVDYGDGNLVSEVITNIDNNTYTLLIGTIKGTQTVKIYSSGISRFACLGSQLTTLDVSRNTELTTLICWGNQLTTLDLSKNTALSKLYCSYNKLTNLDVSNNVALIELSCKDNKLTNLDVSNNTALSVLKCSNNKLTNLDLSKNTALLELECSNNKLTNLDLSKNISLINLYCNLNQLNTIDLSANTSLTNLVCCENKLSTLDISNNTELTHLNCCINQFNFATLPSKLERFLYYKYAPQDPISIKEIIYTFTEFDLSNLFSIAGNITTYKWKTIEGRTLEEGIDYTISGGKTTFLKEQTSRVYCQLTNTSFPNFSNNDVLRTSLARVMSSTSIESVDETYFDIYTNNKTLYINTPINAQILLIDVNGRQIISTQANAGSHNFNMQNSGIYLLKISNGENSFTRKILVE